MKDDMYDGGDPTGRFWNPEHGRGSWAGNIGRAARFRQGWSELVEVGAVDIGPIPAELVPGQWQGALAAGVTLERLSVYLTTAEGRTVYLVGPHTTEGPRGLELREGRVRVTGADEAGVAVSLELPSELVEAFVIIGPRQGRP